MIRLKACTKTKTHLGFVQWRTFTVLKFRTLENFSSVQILKKMALSVFYVRSNMTFLDLYRKSYSEPRGRGKWKSNFFKISLRKNERLCEKNSDSTGGESRGGMRKKNRKEEIGNKGIVGIPIGTMKQHLDNRNRMPRSDGPWDRSLLQPFFVGAGSCEADAQESL